ncbi:DUF5119 domain-containing protein [Bacteroides sp. ET71]|nr:DUF5119 domain-containing protein [Bacteroides sp. ET71]MCL1616609.1 DUF5119 domain-containing protein [Bacteroides sp. ET71]
MTGYARRSASLFGSGKFFIFHSSFIILLLLSGCRKDLCYTHDEHGWAVKVNVVADWEQEWERMHETDWEQNWMEDFSCSYDELRPDVADGIRVLVYPDQGNRYNEYNLEAEGGRLSMAEGMNSLLFYNNDTEYIVFSDLDASAAASATTRTRTRTTFTSTPAHADERTINEPDMLYGTYVDEYEAQKTVEPVDLPLTMRPLVYTYLVRYEFSHGLEYVALARGALAGMAESVYLQDGHTGEEAATVLYDCTLQSYGAEAQVQTFGVPNYPGEGYGRAAQVYTLNLEVRLNNGKILDYEFDVTAQVEKQPRGGVILVDGIEVSDEDGQEGSGGFDVDVDGWGDYVDIPLPLE